MSKKIIVTGGAGFVGTNLIKLLINKTKYNIISLDNYSSGSKKNHIKNKRIKIMAYIKTSELRSDGISVKVHVQKLESGVWTDTFTDNKLASQIENNILNEARNYRINSSNK